jgi:hypothetical protein
VRAGFIHEPQLEFATGAHVDIRFGMMNHGPLDVLNELAPDKIRLGIVGTAKDIEGIHAWVERIGRGVEAKESRQPNLFPRFPGFGEDSSLQAPLVSEPRLHGVVKQRELDNLFRSTDRNHVVDETAGMFLSEMRRLTEKGSVDVLVCAVPDALLDYDERDVQVREEDTHEAGEDSPEDEAKRVNLDFHHLLKARAMDLRVPVQLLQPGTYDPTRLRQQKRRTDRTRRLQDEATRAWNIYTALYYKAGGTPWRLERDPGELTACYVGVSFYRTLHRSQLRTSTAQIFNERGDGIVLRGGEAKLSKDDRQVHLAEEDAYELLDNALRTYREEHRTLPARLVLHKTSPHDDTELSGFAEALRANSVDSADFCSLGRSSTRLFRGGEYPPLRGMFLTLDERNHLLYTRGSVDFFRTYPGMYVPRPLLIRCDEVEQTPTFLAREALALTKMNWNNTQFDNGDPITLRAARGVGNILKYSERDRPQPRYSYYM